MEGSQVPKGEFYSLRWTNYLNNLAETVFNHQSHERLVDVTIVSEGQFIRARKLILSSCSVFFQDMFKTGTGIADITGLNGSIIHPVIVMNGVKFTHLKHIVDFIYQGEIRVLDSDLEGVLALGESMQVKGLCSVKLKQKLSQNENNADPNTQTNCLKLVSSVTPDKVVSTSTTDKVISTSTITDKVVSTSASDNILKPVNSSKSNNTHLEAKDNTKNLKLTVSDNLSTPISQNSIPRKAVTSRNSQVDNENKPKIEKISKPLAGVEKVIPDEKSQVFHKDMSKRDMGQHNKSTLSVKKGDSTSHSLTNVSEQNLEPKLKRIKIATNLLAPISVPRIRTYEKAHKKDPSKAETDIKEISSSSESVHSSKEDTKQEHPIPRPPNAFMIFANDWRKKLSVEHPDENNKDISIRLGNLWKSLSQETRDNYYEEAAKALEEHKIKYPHYMSVLKKSTKKIPSAKRIVELRKSIAASDNMEAFNESSLEIIDCDVNGSDSDSRDTLNTIKSN